MTDSQLSASWFSDKLRWVKTAVLRRSSAPGVTGLPANGARRRRLSGKWDDLSF